MADSDVASVPSLPSSAKCARMSPSIDDLRASLSVAADTLAAFSADEAAMAAFFKWVSDSIGVASKEVQEGGGDVSGMDDLPPPPEEIQVVA